MQDLNELHVQKLVRRKSSLTASAVRALHTSLGQLEQSPRFELLRSLPISNFQFEGRISAGPVEKLTLGELVEQGAIKLSSLPSMGTQRLMAIVGVVEKLLENGDAAGAAVELPETAQELFEGLIPQQLITPQYRLDNITPQSNVQGTPKFISIKTEQALVDVLKRLRRSARLNELSNQSLSLFWEAGAARAPFEECLTFAQLLGLKTDSLLRKRSINENKLKAIIKAVENALSSVAEVESDNQNAQRDVRLTAPLGFSWSSDWVARSSCKTAPAVAMLTVMAALPQTLQQQTAQYQTLLDAVASLPAFLEPEEALVFLLEADYPPEQISQILKKNPTKVAHLSLVAREKLARVLKNEFLKFAEAWNKLLIGVGASAEVLFGAFKVGGQLEELQVALGKGLLRLLGAREWSHDSITLENFFAKDADKLLAAFELLVRTLPISRTDFQSQSDLIVPQLTMEQREIVFNKFAYFDQSLSRWTKI